MKLIVKIDKKIMAIMQGSNDSFLRSAFFRK
jgi:hypothetical protein